MISVIVPVFRNAGNVPELLQALSLLYRGLGGRLEAVFVVDGSPDDSHSVLASMLPECEFPSQLISLSRNFGSFNAIRAGLEAGTGARFAVLAADLQEPPEFIVQADRLLSSGESDVVIGRRVRRQDPWRTRLLSGAFWAIYRRLVLPEMPPGGVDVFACNACVREQILRLTESNSSLVGLLFWVGFRRVAVPYERRERRIGKSAWTLRKKLRYMGDNLFNFSDLPVRALLVLGTLGMLVSLVLGMIVLWRRLTVGIPVPGYAATMTAIIFFGGLNSFGLGVIGSYVWRTFENTKRRPNYIVTSRQRFGRALAAGEKQ